MEGSHRFLFFREHPLTFPFFFEQREQDPRSAFEVSVIQAWLLSSVSGLFCGSRKRTFASSSPSNLADVPSFSVYQHAEIARAGLITAARRMNLLRETTSFVEDLLARKTPTPEELETAQKEDELRLRLGWGIYVRPTPPVSCLPLVLTTRQQIFDNLVSTLLNLQPVVSIAEIADSTFLPEESLLPPSKGRRRFRQVLAVLLTEGRVEGFLTPLSTAIIQLTLFRLCLDASYIDTMLSSVLNVQRTGTYRLVFTPDIKQCVSSSSSSSFPFLPLLFAETRKSYLTASASHGTPPPPPSLLSMFKLPPSLTTQRSPSPATTSCRLPKSALASTVQHERWSRGRR